MQRDLRGKAAWIRRRAKGVVYKIRTRSKFVLYTYFSRTGRSIPKWLRNVEDALQNAILDLPDPCVGLAPDPLPRRGERRGRRGARDGVERLGRGRRPADHRGGHPPRQHDPAAVCSPCSRRSWTNASTRRWRRTTRPPRRPNWPAPTPRGRPAGSYAPAGTACRPRSCRPSSSRRRNRSRNRSCSRSSLLLSSMDVDELYIDRYR